MTTATDAGVRSGKGSTEMRIFLIGGAMILANGTMYVDVPWEIIFGYLGLGGLGMSGRILQKTAATIVSGRAPAEKSGDRNVP